MTTLAVLLRGLILLECRNQSRIKSLVISQISVGKIMNKNVHQASIKISASGRAKSNAQIPLVISLKVAAESIQVWQQISKERWLDLTTFFPQNFIFFILFFFFWKKIYIKGGDMTSKSWPGHTVAVGKARHTAAGVEDYPPLLDSHLYLA